MSRRAPLLLALVLALWPLGLRAAVVRASLYQAPGGEWNAAIAGALHNLTVSGQVSPGLHVLSTPSLGSARGYAPIVAQLEHEFKYNPANFGQLSPAVQAEDLELALYSAQSELKDKAYALTSQAAVLAAPGRQMQPGDVAKLVDLVGQLDELVHAYGPLVPAEALASASDSYERAGRRALQLRNAFIKEAAEQEARALGVQEEEAEETVEARAAAPLPPKPTSGALKAESDFRNPDRRHNHKLVEFDSWITGYGYRRKTGTAGPHRKYSLRGFPTLTVPNHTDLPEYVVDQALEAVDKIYDALGSGRAAAKAAAPAAPFRVNLDDLDILVSQPKPKPAKVKELAPPAEIEVVRREPKRSKPKPAQRPVEVATGRLEAAGPVAVAERPEPPAPKEPEPVLPAAPQRRPWWKVFIPR